MLLRANWYEYFRIEDSGSSSAEQEKLSQKSDRGPKTSDKNEIAMKPNTAGEARKRKACRPAPKKISTEKGNNVESQIVKPEGALLRETLKSTSKNLSAAKGVDPSKLKSPIGVAIERYVSYRSSQHFY